MPKDICPRHGTPLIGCSGCRADALANGSDSELATWTARVQARECDLRFPPHYRHAQADEPAVVSWIQRRLDGLTNRGLLLLGETGVGKTHQGYGAVRAVVTGGRPTTWLATTAADMYAVLRPRGRVDPEIEMRRLRTAGLLFIDDLGLSKSSEWTEEATFRVIDHRYINGHPMIITTNLGATQLRAAVGDRIASRLVECCDRVVLEGPDRRRHQAA